MIIGGYIPNCLILLLPTFLWYPPKKYLQEVKSNELAEPSDKAVE
jgi:hypothetical protein